VHRLLREPELAEEMLSELCDELERIGLEEFLVETLPRLGEVLYSLGRVEEAEAAAVRVEQSEVPRYVITEIEWRKLLGKTRARRGADGESYARAAVEIAETTDMINVRADAYADLAEVLGRASRRQEASEALREAIALYERKGNIVQMKGATELLRQLAGARVADIPPSGPLPA
jgi:tetratricopeptide (TPR) repeat protein